MATEWRIPKASSTDHRPCSQPTLTAQAINLLQSRLVLPISLEYDTPLTTAESDDDDDSNEAGEPDLPPEFREHWEAIMTNPCNFDNWIKLLEYVEKENHLMAGRKAYGAFLTRFPYCFGYWKKYASLEHNFKNTAEAIEVFKRGLEAVPLSVDLWILYIKYMFDNLDMKLPESTEKVRGAFKSASLAAGMEFRSDKLWEMYTDWEQDHGNLQELLPIYDHIFTIPTQLYRKHHDRLKEVVASHPPRDILSPEEFHWIYSKIKIEESVQIAAEDSPSEDDQEGIQLTEEEEKKIREHILETREQMFLLNEGEVRKRWTFEEQITRPYFHVTPLDRAQLQNWKNYLEFETAEGKSDCIVTLYERCLVSCALYEEFWLAYIRYLEVHSVEAARAVFQRACYIHLHQKPSIHLHWAAFEEKHGQLHSARTILFDLEKTVPGLVMVRLRRASLERRCGNIEESVRLLQEAMKNSSGTELAAFYAIKLARLFLKVQGNPDKARNVLNEALESEPDNPRLHLCLLEFEVSRDTSQAEDDALLCVERALRSQLGKDVKMLLSQRRLEFLEDHGSSITKLLSAYDEHQELLKENLKREAENGNEEEHKEKKLKPDAPNIATPEAVLPPATRAPPVTNSPPVPPPKVTPRAPTPVTRAPVTRTSPLIPLLPKKPVTYRPPVNIAPDVNIAPLIAPAPRMRPPLLRHPRYPPPIPKPFFGPRPPYIPGPPFYQPRYPRFESHTNAPPPWHYNRFYHPH